MFVDASAIVAILLAEPDADRYIEELQGASGPVFISPLVRYEVIMALARARSRKSGQAPVSPEAIAAATAALGAFLAEIETEELAITPAIGTRAVEAQQRYGKLVGHPAKLNFGDCFAYGCATAHGLSLLYKGDDFGRIDPAG